MSVPVYLGVDTTNRIRSDELFLDQVDAGRFVAVNSTRLTMSDNELVMRFFSMFSRYEYAIKAAGHVHVRGGDAAEPDWQYVIDVLGKLDNESFERLRERADILVTDPPRKQVYRNGALEFVSTESAGSAAADLTVWLRRVRNNLFHGGKYTREFAVLDDRSRKLIHCSISVLDGLLSVSALEDLADRFRGYSPSESEG